MGLFSDLRQAIKNLALMGDMPLGAYRERMERNALERDYYEGDHREQLARKEGQANDNIIANFTGLVVDRAISMLLGNGVEFDLPGDPEYIDDPETGEKIKQDQPNQEYIDEIWLANKKDILLHKSAQFGGMHGTCYLEIVPDAIQSRTDAERFLPRLIPLDPAYMTVDTSPEDIDNVIRYVMVFPVVIGDQKYNRKHEVERATVTVDKDGNPTNNPEEIEGMMDQNWVINEYITDSSGKWQQYKEPEIWPFEFPPIIHWQNLPLAGNEYGRPDISPDVIDLQDRINFVASNINRIIRYHAHPKTWGRGAGMGGKMSWGADEVLLLQGDNAMLENLEMQSDLVSSRDFFRDLRQALFDITRTPDITSMSDKLGALTNFGLRVLFMDALAKLGSKQKLYGEALTEVNHRMLVLQGGFEDTDGGKVLWQDPLPVSEQEATEAQQFDLDNGIASKETVATKRGYNWIQERNRIAKEREEAQANSDNIGSILLKNFNNGGNQP